MAHLSYWFKQALELEQPQPAKPLNEDINADVAIIGGGYTGLWTAIMIKQQAPKKHVVVIEKGLCGSGASGANGGCMLTWSTKFPTLKRLFGEAQAAWLVKESEQAALEMTRFVNSTILTLSCRLKACITLQQITRKRAACNLSSMSFHV